MRTSLRACGVLLVGALSAGCLAPQGLQSPSQGATVVFQQTKDAGQYRSPLPREAPTRHWVDAEGEACRTVLSWPVNPPTPFIGSATAAQFLPWPSFSALWGNDSYARAVRRASESAGGGVLYDVRADLHTVAFLGIVRRECIVVHALASKT